MSRRKGGGEVERAVGGVGGEGEARAWCAMAGEET